MLVYLLMLKDADFLNHQMHCSLKESYTRLLNELPFKKVLTMLKCFLNYVKKLVSIRVLKISRPSHTNCAKNHTPGVLMSSHLKKKVLTTLRCFLKHVNKMLLNEKYSRCHGIQKGRKCYTAMILSTPFKAYFK